MRTLLNNIFIVNRVRLEILLYISYLKTLVAPPCSTTNVLIVILTKIIVF
nr:MAG TPA: hypothetical protein [Caudoviricetes sp.]